MNLPVLQTGVRILAAIFSACVFRITTLHIFSRSFIFLCSVLVAMVKWIINDRLIFRRDLVLVIVIVSIMQDTYNVSISVKIVIFLENKFIILIR